MYYRYVPCFLISIVCGGGLFGDSGSCGDLGFGEFLVVSLVLGMFSGSFLSVCSGTGLGLGGSVLGLFSVFFLSFLGLFWACSGLGSVLGVCSGTGLCEYP